MASLVSTPPMVGGTTDVHTSALNVVGSIAHDANYNYYIYLKGVAGVAVGSWVIYDELGATILLDTDLVDQGDAAVAMAAVVADRWGWFCIKSKGVPALALTALADNALIFATSTGGSVDDTDTGVGYVHGALSRSVVNETTFLFTAQISYPFLTGADLPN